MTLQIDALLSDYSAISDLPHSKCRNCDASNFGHELRLYKGRWYHVEMFGGEYYRPSGCGNPQPLRCKECGGRIDYKTTDPDYYDYTCPTCIEKEKDGAKIGELTDELRKQLAKGKGRYLQYGTMCSVVITKGGVFFVDIC